MLRLKSLMLAALAAVTTASSASIANTTYGPVEGKTLESKVKAWLSVPFAQSPPERFAPPQAPQRWTEPKKTVELPASCIQQFTYPKEARDLLMQVYSNPMPRESEDCLYLNVWAPSEPAPAEGYPVMFWIHGGNLQIGTSAMATYDGENMAKNRKVVVVTINYRTNVFGFPNSFELNRDQSNLGFLDQRAALDWTHKNVASFGGNPQKVTIFGQSAGGYSVKQLLANPPSPMPFHAAIMQSQASGVHGGAESWEKLAEKLQCNPESRLACVRAAPATKIKDIIEKEKLIFGPREDDLTYVNDVRPSIASGKFAKVPMLIGTNADEGTVFAKTGLIAPGSNLKTFFGNFVPGGTDVAEFVLSQLRPLYSGPAYDSDFKLGSGIFTDLGFTCPALTLSKALVDGGYDVQRYYYDANFAEQQPFENADVWHGAEIEAIFGTFTAKEARMKGVSDAVQSAWTEFGKNPVSGLKDWPKLTTTDEPVKKFDTKGVSMIKAADIDSKCATVGTFSQGAGV